MIRGSYMVRPGDLWKPLGSLPVLFVTTSVLLRRPLTRVTPGTMAPSNITRNLKCL